MEPEVPLPPPPSLGVCYSLGPFGVKIMPSILSCCLLIAFLSFQPTNLSYIGIPFHCIHNHLSVFVDLSWHTF